jgi:hypothetical protein
MASASLTCAEWDEKPVYWSTIAYLRVWWASDGVRLAAIRAAGRITPEMLRDLGTEYNVNRSITRPDKNKGAPDVNAQAVCDLLEQQIPHWPADLKNRIIFCKEIINAIKKVTHEEGDELASATTKFIWFLRPDRWTIFDKFAAKGIRVPTRHEKASIKMGHFYKLLIEHDFIGLTSLMQDSIDRSPLFEKKNVERRVPATRIIDTLLMARGGRGGDQEAIDGFKEFLALLPCDLSGAVHDLASTLQNLAPDHVLTKSTRPPIRRSRKR